VFVVVVVVVFVLFIFIIYYLFIFFGFRSLFFVLRMGAIVQREDPTQ